MLARSGEGQQNENNASWQSTTVSNNHETVRHTLSSDAVLQFDTSSDTCKSGTPQQNRPTYAHTHAQADGFNEPLTGISTAARAPPVTSLRSRQRDTSSSRRSGEDDNEEGGEENSSGFYKANFWKSTNHTTALRQYEEELLRLQRFGEKTSMDLLKEAWKKPSQSSVLIIDAAKLRWYRFRGVLKTRTSGADTDFEGGVEQTYASQQMEATWHDSVPYFKYIPVFLVCVTLAYLFYTYRVAPHIEERIQLPPDIKAWGSSPAKVGRAASRQNCVDVSDSALEEGKLRTDSNQYIEIERLREHMFSVMNRRPMCLSLLPIHLDVDFNWCVLVMRCNASFVTTSVTTEAIDSSTHLLFMMNPTVAGRSTEVSVNEEISAFCPNALPVEKERPLKIYADFISESGAERQREFIGLDARVVVGSIEQLDGEGIC